MKKTHSVFFGFAILLVVALIPGCSFFEDVFHPDNTQGSDNTQGPVIPEAPQKILRVTALNDGPYYSGYYATVQLLDAAGTFDDKGILTNGTTPLAVSKQVQIPSSGIIEVPLWKQVGTQSIKWTLSGNYKVRIELRDTPTGPIKYTFTSNYGDYPFAPLAVPFLNEVTTLEYYIADVGAARSIMIYPWAW
ncbi:hypothetical protein AGMMS49579_04760 [Spirochaetia bacterium]|nr:hypothetical protein AGMMS49579_04760 [Spirochaetia bacterium]